jgi:flagellar biosynthesis/type III secretory pathway chaperone
MNPGFAPCLAAEIAAVQRFVALLGEEKQVLGNGKTEELTRVIEAKGKLAEELTALGAARQAALVALGVPESSSAVENWLRAQKNPRLLEGWQTLQQLAREAQTLNELNGQCIALLSRNNRQLMDALAGQQASAATYGPDGQTPRGAGLRIRDSV